MNDMEIYSQFSTNKSKNDKLIEEKLWENSITEMGIYLGWSLFTFNSLLISIPSIFILVQFYYYINQYLDCKYSSTLSTLEIQLETVFKSVKKRKTQ